MANSFVAMDENDFLLMKQAYRKKKMSESDLSAASVNFANWLYRQLVSLVGIKNPVSTTAGQQVINQIGTNIGTSFSALKDFVVATPGGISKLFTGITGKLVKWLQALGNGVGRTSKWMSQPLSGKWSLGGARVTNGTFIALAALSAVILIAGRRIFKNLASGIKQGMNESEMLKDLDECQKLGEEMIDLMTEQTLLQEGIFDMFTWLGRIVGRAFRFVSDLIETAHSFIQRYPKVATVVFVCCFFVMMCTPMMSTVLRGATQAMRA